MKMKTKSQVNEQSKQIFSKSKTTQPLLKKMGKMSEKQQMESKINYIIKTLQSKQTNDFTLSDVNP